MASNFVPAPAVGIGGDNLESLNHGEFDLSPVERKYSPIQGVYRVSAQPQHDGSMNESSVAVFIAADPTKVTRLWSMKMGGQVRLERKVDGEGDWKTIKLEDAEAEHVGVINNFLHAMFSRVEITLGGGTRIADSGTRPYVYKSYFEQLLNCTRTFQRDNLRHHGYIPDTTSYSEMTYEEIPNPNKADLTEDQKKNATEALKIVQDKYPLARGGDKYNQPWWDRRKPLIAGGNYEFYMPIYHDLLKVRKCLPPGVEMKINFYFNIDEFPIWCGSENKGKHYRLAFEKDSFYIDYERFLVKKEITKAYQRALAADRYLALPIVRTLVKSYRVKKEDGKNLGRRNWITNSPHLPSQVIVCFVKADAYEGSLRDNPYNLEHVDLRSASLIINSATEPAEGYDTGKYGSNPVGKAFFWKMMREIGHVSEAQFETALTMEGFFDDQFFLCFDRSPSKDNSFVGALYDSGSLGLHLDLRGKLKHDLQVIALMSYSSNVCIYNNTVRIEYFD